MINKLSLGQIQGIMDALPVELIFVDENERLLYWNKVETRMMKPSPKRLGMDIRDCHKPESLPWLEQMVSDFKSENKDEAEFWLRGMEHKILNRFFAVRDKSGKYLGILEYILDFTAMEKLAEEKKGAPYSSS